MGQLHDDVDIVLCGEVDRLVRPETADKLVIILPCGRDHPCPDRLRKLDRYCADAPGTAMNENGLADGELGTRDESLPDRSSNEGEACGLQMTDVPWLAADKIDIGDVLLGIGPRTTKNLRCVIDFVSSPEFADVRSYLLNDTRNVMSDDGGKRHVVGVVAAADLVVERIYGGCVDTHPHLPRPDRQHGNVAQFERVSSTETAKHDSFHVVSHFECPLCRSGRSN
jgi:hypothetical protein